MNVRKPVSQRGAIALGVLILALSLGACDLESHYRERIPSWGSISPCPTVSASCPTDCTEIKGRPVDTATGEQGAVETIGCALSPALVQTACFVRAGDGAHYVVVSGAPPEPPDWVDCEDWQPGTNVR